jgi:hypothetical protein
MSIRELRNVQAPSPYPGYLPSQGVATNRRIQVLVYRLLSTDRNLSTASAAS